MVVTFPNRCTYANHQYRPRRNDTRPGEPHFAESVFVVIQRTIGIEVRGRDQAFVIRSGSVDYLPNVRRQHYGQGNALNASIVVGATAEAGIFPYTATMWDSRGRRSALLPSSWSYSVASGVNGAGKIVGYGDNGSGAIHAWLLR